MAKLRKKLFLWSFLLFRMGGITNFARSARWALRRTVPCLVPRRSGDEVPISSFKPIFKPLFFSFIS